MKKKMMNNYCKGIVIVQRKEEYYFLQYLKCNFHLPIKVFLVNLDGKITNLKKIEYLLNDKKICKEIYLEKEKNEIKNFSIILVLNINDIKDIKNKNEYLEKEYFKELWFEKYVVSIYMNCNFKDLLVGIGAIDEREKLETTTYMNLVPINDFEMAKLAIKKLIKKLEMNKESNFKILLEKCLEFL